MCAYNFILREFPATQTSEHSYVSKENYSISSHPRGNGLIYEDQSKGILN